MPMDILLGVFVPALVTLLVIVDPPGCAPIFGSLTQQHSPAQRRTMAVRAVIIAAFILAAFAFVGEAFLEKLGISLNAFRIAGGLLLLGIAIEMVFEKRTERREQRAEQIAHEAADRHAGDRHGAMASDSVVEVEDVSVFPMAMPLLAGPGAITSVMLLMSQHGASWQGQLAVTAAIGLTLGLTLLALLAAGPVMRVMGKTVTLVITRLLGVILTALAVQFIIDGVRGAFAIG